MRKCTLQSEFFKVITSKIWAEKVNTEIDQVMWNHKKQVLYVWDQEKNRRVNSDNGEGVEWVEDTYCYSVKPEIVDFASPLVRKDNGELELIKGAAPCKQYGHVQSHYETSFQNLGELGSDLAEIYANAYSGVETYISHCIRKTMSFNRLDFYCMTDEGEKADFTKMNPKYTD